MNNITGTIVSDVESIPFTNEDYIAVRNQVAFVKQLLMQLTPTQLKLLAYANDYEAPNQFELHFNSIDEDDEYSYWSPLDIEASYLWFNHN